ncbi:hypothetical protein G9A89_008643 [Geosiphon pyriformis]|nr:hypothetical protein G9A89_008643 [Geosiphon pyriformis]
MSIIEPGFNVSVKSNKSKKKKKSGALKNNISSSKTGNTTESDNIDMKKEFLVKETSFDYGEDSATAGRDLKQTPKSSKIQTKRALGKLLRKINFLGNSNNNILLDKLVVFPSPLKNLINVLVGKSFTLDISLNNVVKKSTQKKLVGVRKLFSKVNGFGKAFIPSKFAGIVRAIFTFELSLMKATKLATNVKILVNTDLKKSFGHSDQAVVTVHAALFEFGMIKSVKMQLMGLWQKAIADFLASRWFILIGKDTVHVVRANLDKQMWDFRDLHKALLYTLPVGTNAHDIWDYIGSVDGKTCMIDFRCAIVCFGSAKSLNAVMGTTSVLKGAHLCWSYLGSAVCAKCDKMDHTSLSCSSGGKIFSGSLSCRVLSDADKNRLVAIYAKHLVPVSYSVSFGGVLWAKIVVGSFFLLFPVRNVLLNDGFFSEMKPTPHVSPVLNNRFAALECSLVSLAECMDELAKRLDALGPTVSQLSPGWVNIVMSESLGVATGGKTVARVMVFNPTVISKMEEILNNLSITVMSLSAKMDNTGLEDVVCWHRKSGNLISIVIETKLRFSCRPWIKNRFDSVRVFPSSLDAGFSGAGIAIIMNISLAYHVCKISEMPGWLLSIKLLFKNKLSVLILRLYAGAFLAVCFTQAGEVNSLIAKTVNEFSFVILGGNFNKDGSHKYTSFKKYSDFGLVNSLGGNLFVRNVSKMIDYVFVSSSLANAVVHHGVLDISEHFDTDHQAVSVSVSLGGLLDVQLNFFHKQANKDHWKFNFKDLDIMWDAVCKSVTLSASEIFKKKWFKDSGHIFTKEFSKFHKLELLVSKIVRAFHGADVNGFALVIQNLVNSGATFNHVCSAFCIIRKSYCALKCVESLRAKKANIKSAIDKRMESFEINKSHTIRSVLKCPFHKVVLDHLVVNNELVLEPGLVKFKPLEYVFNRAFSGVMCSIGFDKFFGVVSNLPDGKAASFSETWVSMILKPYEWKGVLTNTHLITLIETTCKILSKIFSDRIFSACSTFDVLCGDNFSSVIKNALKKDWKFWLVLQNMQKAYNLVGWEHLEKSLVRIKMCDKFIQFFGNWIKERFFSPFSVYEYKINSHFIFRSGCAESQAGFSFFLAANTFVDNTIWVGSSQNATQHILNVASEFFWINDISINNDKTVAIPINSRVSHSSLFISSLPISVVCKGESHQYLGIFLSTESLSKPNLTKAHSDVRFFTNLVLKKAVSDKQFLYLVSVVLYSIVGYRTQFSFVLINVCNKWDALIHKSLKLKSGLLLDFPGDTIYHPFFYGLKSFLQCQSESKIASLISFVNSGGILGHLFSHRPHDLQVLCWCPLYSLSSSARIRVSASNNFLSGMVVLWPALFDFSLFFKFLSSFQHYGIVFVDQLHDHYGDVFNWCTFKQWKKLDLCGPVPDWFKLSVAFFIGPPPFSSALDSVGSLNVCEFSDFVSIYDHLSQADAAAFFKDINLGLGVSVYGLVSSTLAELQAIILALEYILRSCSVCLFSDSQAALDACKSEINLMHSDFCNQCWVEYWHISSIIHSKNLEVTWYKVKSHFGILKNDCANSLADTASLFG